MGVGEVAKYIGDVINDLIPDFEIGIDAEGNIKVDGEIRGTVGIDIGGLGDLDALGFKTSTLIISKLYEEIINSGEHISKDFFDHRSRISRLHFKFKGSPR